MPQAYTMEKVKGPENQHLPFCAPFEPKNDSPERDVLSFPHLPKLELGDETEFL